MDLVRQSAAFLYVPLLWLRMTATGGPLPARLLYSGFSALRKNGWVKKRRLNRSPFRSSFFGSPVHWEKGFLWLSEAAPLPVWFISGQPRGVFKTIQDHIIFGKKIYQDLKLWVRRLWGDGGSSCQCQSGAKYLLFFHLGTKKEKHDKAFQKLIVSANGAACYPPLCHTSCSQISVIINNVWKRLFRRQTTLSMNSISDFINKCHSNYSGKRFHSKKM